MPTDPADPPVRDPDVVTSRREPSEEEIERVAAALWRGEVVALPTDTVYGIGARALDRDATARLFELKGRPESVAVAVLVADLSQALELAEEGSGALELLAEAFWPGALTVVVALREEAPVALGGDGRSIGVRLADDDAIRELARRCGPLAVTSANLHGEPPITDPEQLAQAFPTLLLLDGGRRERPPSSVVSLLRAEPEILREGELSPAEILGALRRGGSSPTPGHPGHPD